MNSRTWRISVIAVVAIVAALMVGIVLVLAMESSGSMDQDSGLMALAFLSTTLTTVVIIFGAVSLSGSRSEEYQKYIEEKEREEMEKR